VNKTLFWGRKGVPEISNNRKPRSTKRSKERKMKAKGKKQVLAFTARESDMKA